MRTALAKRPAASPACYSAIERLLFHLAPTMEEPLQGAEVGDELCAICFMLRWMFLMANRAEFMRYSKIGLLWKWTSQGQESPRYQHSPLVLYCLPPPPCFLSSVVSAVKIALLTLGCLLNICCYSRETRVFCVLPVGFLTLTI